MPSVLDDFKINEAQKLIREAETQESLVRKIRFIWFLYEAEATTDPPVTKDHVFKTWFNNVS